MRVIICGGRKFMDKDLMWLALPHVLTELRARKHDYSSHLTIIEGGASGADYLAGQYALENGIALEEYPADWRGLGKAAGAIRNIQMLSTGVDGVIAFPGGNGTQHMMDAARLAGVEVIQVHVGDFISNANSTEYQLQGAGEEASAGDELSGLPEASESQEPE